MPIFYANNNYFIQSKLIHVYPCANRGVSLDTTKEEKGPAIDVESRLNTEYNLTHTGGLCNQNNNSYILDYTIDANGKNKLAFVINGYYFEILGCSEESAAFVGLGKQGYYYAYIKLCEKDIDTSDSTKATTLFLSNMLEPDAQEPTYLDCYCQRVGDETGAYYFGGLALAKEKPDGPNYYSLQLFDNTGDDTSGARGLCSASFLPKIKAGTGWNAITMNTVGDADHSNVATGDGAIAIGFDTKAEGAYSFAGGQSTIASGIGSHAEGGGTYEQYYTGASGDYSHVEGDCTVAKGHYSHAEGKNTKAADQASHAEGWQTSAEGEASHAEGMDTTAKGNNSHAEGDSTIAGGLCSHAEGYNNGQTREIKQWQTATDGTNELVTIQNVLPGALGSCSHAEGNSTIAFGSASHAEGKNTNATGAYSHVEGCNTNASGNYSHAGGFNTTAGYNYQTVIGKYNSNSEDNIFEIGYGTDRSKRKNVFSVGTNGNVGCTGDIGCTGNIDCNNEITCNKNTVLGDIICKNNISCDGDIICKNNISCNGNITFKPDNSNSQQTIKVKYLYAGHLYFEITNNVGIRLVYNHVLDEQINFNNTADDILTALSIAPLVQAGDPTAFKAPVVGISTFNNYLYIGMAIMNTSNNRVIVFSEYIPYSSDAASKWVYSTTTTVPVGDVEQITFEGQIIPILTIE